MPTSGKGTLFRRWNTTLGAWENIAQVKSITGPGMSRGTSDTTAFTITNLPAIITPRDSQIRPMIGLHDNTANIVDRGSVKIGSDKIITFYSDNHAGAWTAGATAKGFGTSGNSVIYCLRSPEKL